MDGSVVRALAARVDAVAHAVGEEAGLLRSLVSTGWSGPAAQACERAVDGRAARADRLRDDLHEAAALLRAQAGAVDRALADLAEAAVGGAAGVAAGAAGASGTGPAAGGLARGALTGARSAW